MTQLLQQPERIAIAAKVLVETGLLRPERPDKIYDDDGKELPAGETGEIFVGNQMLLEEYTSGEAIEFVDELPRKPGARSTGRPSRKRTKRLTSQPFACCCVRSR